MPKIRKGHYRLVANADNSFKHGVGPLQHLKRVGNNHRVKTAPLEVLQAIFHVLLDDTQPLANSGNNIRGVNVDSEALNAFLGLQSMQ